MSEHNRNHSAIPDEIECAKERLSTSESIASVSMAVFGIFTLIRGSYWIMDYENPTDIELYVALISAAPLYIWGALFAIGGLLLILSSWFLPRRHIRKRFALSMLSGGLTVSVTYFIVAVAGFNNANSWMMPAQMVSLALFGGILAFFGGMQLWQMFTAKRNL